MATITLDGKPVQTAGSLPDVGSPAPGFSLSKTDLTDCKLEDYSGKRLVISIFPSIGTSVCSASVRRFNAEAGSLSNTLVLCVSADLPFAHQSFCEAEGLDNVIPLSSFRSADFGRDYGVEILDGPFRGLLSRAVVIIDETGQVIYTEQVPEIGQEPDYDTALAKAAG